MPPTLNVILFHYICKVKQISLQKYYVKWCDGDCQMFKFQNTVLKLDKDNLAYLSEFSTLNSDFLYGWILFTYLFVYLFLVIMKKIDEKNSVCILG